MLASIRTVRTNTVAPHKVARGYHSDNTKSKRASVFLDPETFSLLREEAVKRNIGMSAILREVVDAGLLCKLPRS